MTSLQTEGAEKLRNDRAKRAIALAMDNRWSDALVVNLSILSMFSDDLEAHNRLGKALTELGRHREARDAFQRALEISPHNAIARKNLGRLMRLGDDAPPSEAKNSSTAPQAFIEESGKTSVTLLTNPASSQVLLKMAPGHPINLQVEGGVLKAVDPADVCVGQVEPRLASKLTRLIKGGNRYEATVTSATEQELMIIIREVYQHPSLAGTVSFPSRGGVDYGVYLPNTILGYDFGDEETEETEGVVVKDWSDDDTEPGDDEAFSPVIHRIIKTGERQATEEEEV
jgi:hypothetical protein